MDTTNATQAMQAPSWSDPRIHLLDDTWLLTIFAVLLATVVPWLLGDLDINFIAAALGLLALGAIHVALTVIGRPARQGERRPVLSTLHMAGIVILGLIWLQAGGLQNPGFLLVFALPVVGAIFLSRWQPYLMALLAVVIAGTVALAQVPELRWYVPGLTSIGAGLATALQQDGAASTPFPGFYAPSGYYVVMLQVFAILIFACAVAAEYLGSIFERLSSHVVQARDEAQQAQEFWTSLIERLPDPALLVDADTLKIVCASDKVAAYCEQDPTNAPNLFEAIRFSYPDVVQELIVRPLDTNVGVAPLSMIHVANRVRATEIRVCHLAQKGRRFAIIVIDDKTEEFTLAAALDVTGQAALVIDSRARIVSFNKPAQALFATIEKDAEASELLAVGGMPARWWEPGLSGRRKMHVELGPRIYQVTCSATPLPGEEDRLYVVTLLPVARAALAANAQTPMAEKTASSRSTLVSPL